MAQLSNKGFIVMLCLLLATTACQPIRPSPPLHTGEVEVPFETVALDEEGLVPLASEDPLLLMITSSTEIPAIADRVSYDNLEKLKAVDFQHNVVIALFRDMQLSTGYPTYIKRIGQRNQQWVVYAEFWAPPAISQQGMAITATYHLVKVAKHEQTYENIELVLQTQIITPTPPARLILIRRKSMKWQISFLVIAVSLVILTSGWFIDVSAQNVIASPPLDSPLPTPIVTPVSPEADAALKFISEQQSIPVEELRVAGEELVEFTLLSRDYTLITILHDLSDTFREFSLFVDPTTLQIEPDVNAIWASENAAHLAKYGKLDVALYERLETIGDETTTPIVIWAAHTDTERSHEELVAELVNLYPEAAKAQQEYGVAWAMEDTKLSETIEQKYSELSSPNITSRTQALIEWLKERGYPVQEFSGMPALSTTVTKRDITVLAEREDVAQIHLNDPETIPLLDQAIPTERIPAVWSRGFIGSNVKLAILERNKINAAASGCMTILDRGPTPLPANEATHKSYVATIAACNDSIFRGVAYGAQILDAAYEPTDPNWFVNALIWAGDTKMADVVNFSEGQTGGNSGLYWHDRAFDYWVRARTFTAALAAGNLNNGAPVLTPAKGWNGITVGAFMNKADSACNPVVTGGTATWSDDVIWDCSSYSNPTTGVEKPEVVAVANNTTIVSSDRGTSTAAPHVAGLAALLMQRQAALKNLPTAVKAIVMASAVHNIEGDARLSDKDGAGGIDAALADQIAQTQGGSGSCNTPCWWSINTTSSSPSVNSSVDRFFNAARGERVRIVIAWLSQADSSYVTDSLLTNYNLYIYRSNGSFVASSVSSVNGFEIVDFTAPENDQYKVQIYRSSSGDNNEASNTVGIAWIKLATYLPDIRSNSGGWTSSLYVRNDDAEPRVVRVTYFNTNGTYNSEVSNTLQPAALWISPALPANWQGSAIVDGSEDLSVVVRNNAAGQANLDNGFLSIGSVVDPAFAQPATTLYAPALYINIFGGLNSAIYLQNPNKDAANVTLNFIARATYTDLNPVNLTLPANGSTAYFLGGSAWVGSLRVTATQPVAVKLTESQGSTVMRSYNATAVGKKLIYVPAAYKTYYGFNTGIVIQNLHASSATNVTVTYCDRLYTTCYTETIPGGLPAQKAYGINLGTTTAIPPANWTGSVKVESTGNVPLALAVTNSNSVGGYDFNATGDGGKLIYLPRAARNTGGRTTGYTIRNITNGNVTVTTTYYDVNGTLHPGGVRTDILTPAQVVGYHQSLDGFLADGWEGSIVIESTGNVAVIMREDSVDTVSGYNGIAR